VFTASSRSQKAAPNDAASHPRRPAPARTQDSATDRLLALAGQPVSTLPAVRALARFTAAVTTQQGIAAAGTLLRALRPVDASAALPAGAALTAWVTGAAAVAAPASDDPAVAMVVCAAARALGDDCLAAVAAGLEAASAVESGLDGVAGAGWSAPTVAAGIGACLAAGLMLQLPEAGLRSALGVCATQAAGLRTAAETDAGPLQAGKAAFNAVEAALLAREGFTGAAEPLDGRRGLFALFRSS
jgi:MmgE/PrpD N-terminal domain